MTIQYEDIYPSFTSLSYLQKLELIEVIRKRRYSYFTPKRNKKAAKQESATRQSAKSTTAKLLSELSPAEKEQLLKELDDGS
jgi:hypothetical protein